MYWIVDVVFFVLLIGGILLGVKKGFIEGLCSLAGTLFALVFAFFFCVSFEGFLENTFHMTTALSDKLVGAFASNPNMNVEIGGDTATALQNAGIPGFLANFMASALGSNTLPEGTTAAMLFGATVGKWIAILISFLALVILVRLGAFLLSKLLSGVVNKIAPLRIVNKLAGGILGLAKSLILLFIALAICRWLPIESVHQFISSSSIVGKLFVSEWYTNAVNYAVSFQWFNDYVAKFLQ